MRNRECSKLSVQQGRSGFGARNVTGSVREHGEGARTPLAAIFNIAVI